jgi:hypothetical protein
MKILKLGMSFVAGLFAIGVHSEPLNFDIGYSKLHYKETNYPRLDVDHVKIAVSRNNFEALASVNVKSSEGTLSGVAYKLKVPYVLGLYYKPEISLGSGVDVFAKFGVANTNVKAKNLNTGVEANGSSSGLSYGLGMSLLSTRTSKITFDYTSYSSQVKGFSLTHTFLYP